jgi:HAE1 family hydrophobic/amphiphilic exporter-1
MTIVGVVAMVQLPIALYPSIAPPEIQLQTTYVGADALTLEQAVAAPVEQQMTGVANMIYMYSISASSGGQMTLRVDFDLTTDPSIDQVLAQSRWGQAQSQLPPPVGYGVTVKLSAAVPGAVHPVLAEGDLRRPYRQLRLREHQRPHDPRARFGAGDHLRLPSTPCGSGEPRTLGKLDITVNEIINAINAQNTVNPSGQIGAEPVPPGQEYTATVRAQGRLVSQEDFDNVIIRARPDGSFVRMKDVARADLGAQNYTTSGLLNGRPGAIIAIYQLPGSNAIDTMRQARALMERLKTRFPNDLEYVVALDTTLAVTEGIREIVKTLFEALILVIIVVFVFLQGVRTTLIPLLAVPVSLVGTFALFPLLGFSINTLSLFALVLAIGLVVDDAIVSSGGVYMERDWRRARRRSGHGGGLRPRGGDRPHPHRGVRADGVHRGITGRMYQQFAVTIAVSVIISAFNAAVSPALAAMLPARSEMRVRSACSSAGSTAASPEPPTAT